MAKKITTLDPDTQTDKEDDLKQELKARYSVASEHYEAWDAEAKEDYRFARGEQWTEEEKTKLKEQARPAMTFNRIRAIINLIAGYQRENAARIKVNPEGGEDRTFSEVMDRAIKHVDKVSHLTYKFGYWFDDGLYCGKGFLEALISYDNDPIRGELDFRLRSPYQIRVDPECSEYDLNKGARYCFKTVRLSREELKALYPDKKKLIDGFVQDDDDEEVNGVGSLEGAWKTTDDDMGNRKARNKSRAGVRGKDIELEQDGKFTVKEYWRTKMVEKFYVVDLDGEPIRYDTEEEANKHPNKVGKVIPRKVKEMHVSAMVCGWILQDEKSPFEPFYSGFPFFRYIADWAPNAENEKQKVQGITRPLKDCQREKNKAKSQHLHILNTQANSGWVADEDAMTPGGFQDLEKMGSKPGLVIKKKRGSELREIQAKTANMGMIQREEKADYEFTQIIGVNPDLMGMQEGTASGKAIGLRIKQAVLALVRPFTNYRYSKEIVGNFILDMLPMLFDTKKMMKILGPDFLIKEADPEKFPGGLNEGIIDAFLQMIKDNKYDVLVTEADQNSTIRYEIFQEMSELAGKGLPIPLTLLIDYMDLPNAEEVKQKIQEEQAMQQAMAMAGAAQPAKKPQGAKNG